MLKYGCGKNIAVDTLKEWAAGGDILIAARDRAGGRDVLQAGWDRHWRTGFVRERLDVGTELQVFGGALEGGGGQLERQRHHVTCGGGRIRGSGSRRLDGWLVLWGVSRGRA